MKYYEITFRIEPPTGDAADLLCALAGEAGCESFESTADGVKAYAQQELFSPEMLDAVLADFPFAGTHISYTVGEAEYRDWNEAWEQEGFQPISVGDIVIHDGHHLPAHSGVTEIEIRARQAFGTGTHETTRMICRHLAATPLDGAAVLDCGCGTGILGICALKRGARHCVAYDIDEWSTENTRHNAAVNGVEPLMTILLGDATVTDTMEERFDVVMANINRNILLQDMPRFARMMKPQAQLVVSGFYTDDCCLLADKARQLGLTHRHTYTDGSWACMVFAAPRPSL